MMFDFMRTVALLVCNTIYTVGESSMFSLPAILALRNTRVHVGFLDDCNVLFYIKISVNKTSSLCIILSSSQMVDLVFLYFTFHFYFYSVLFFYFLFLEQLGLGLISHAVTSVTT